jgi:uncharacterized protein involved in exopolysaccharide biosynthesis
VTASSAQIPPSDGWRESSDDGEVSVLGLLNVLLRHRGLVACTALICAGLVAVVTLIGPRTFTAVSGMTPQSRRSTSSLMGVAAQFGLVLPNADGAQSPAFYADLLTSPPLLGAVVDTRFEYPSDTGQVRGTLVDIYRSKGATAPLRRDAAIRHLNEDVDATTIQKTGVVKLSVTARNPVLALGINRRLLELLNQFNLETRQSQAAAERRFTERRLGEVRQDLRAAEDQLQQFLQRNREYRSSPELSFQQDRLQREVLLQQQIFGTMAQAFEQAKIDEVRDTPVITVVQPPEAPVRPDPRGVVWKTVMTLVLGAFFGMALAIGRAYAVNARSLHSPEVREFDQLRRQTLDDLIRPWRPLRRVLRRSATTTRESL